MVSKSFQDFLSAFFSDQMGPRTQETTNNLTPATNTSYLAVGIQVKEGARVRLTKADVCMNLKKK